VLVDERPLERADRLAVRRRIGYVIQEGGLFPHLTVRGNLALLPHHLDWPRERIETRARELTQLMQLPQTVLDRYPAELSGGQRQRVAVMRALMTDPPALLLDEPLGALDPLVRFELQERLQQLFHSLGKTVLLVTHDLPEAAYLATRLILMRSGRIVQDGDAADLYERPADEFVRRFVAAQRGPPPRSR
jgi:osmoprotectant transport system ATP-binding protein